MSLKDDTAKTLQNYELEYERTVAKLEQLKQNIEKARIQHECNHDDIETFSCVYTYCKCTSCGYSWVDD